MINVLYFLALAATTVTANLDMEHCVDPLVEFMDQRVHKYLEEHTLPSTNIARAQFYDGKLSQSASAQRVDPSNVHSQDDRVFIESRIRIPVFRTTFKCKYQAIWEHTCPDVNITTSDAYGLASMSFGETDRILKLEDLQLISADTDVQASPYWLKLVVEGFASRGLKTRFGATYKGIINKAALQLPEHIAVNCIKATQRKSRCFDCIENTLSNLMSVESNDS
ncbi:hypothetical protein HDE_03195 [Halotydeus destructor]|nr:hypothetical protein HDE_03195 [Halotydeus destructor]